MSEDGATHQEAELASTAAPHPEEMKAEVRFRAGPFTLEARARATPAGLVSVAVLVATVMLPVVAMIRGRKR